MTKPLIFFGCAVAIFLILLTEGLGSRAEGRFPYRVYDRLSFQENPQIKAVARHQLPLSQSFPKQEVVISISSDTAVDLIEKQVLLETEKESKQVSFVPRTYQDELRELSAFLEQRGESSPQKAEIDNTLMHSSINEVSATQESGGYLDKILNPGGIFNRFFAN